MSSTYIILALITSGVVTFAIRLFPFLVLRNQTNYPPACSLFRRSYHKRLLRF